VGFVLYFTLTVTAQYADFVEPQPGDYQRLMFNLASPLMDYPGLIDLGAGEDVQAAFGDALSGVDGVMAQLQGLLATFDLSKIEEAYHKIAGAKVHVLLLGSPRVLDQLKQIMSMTGQMISIMADMDALSRGLHAGFADVKSALARSHALAPIVEGMVKTLDRAVHRLSKIIVEADAMTDAWINAKARMYAD
jgi:hypothetical protein